MDILTKAGDPEGALRVAKQLLAKSPGNSQLRRQCAQLARWSGRAEESLEHWAWLAKRGSEDARQKALELARALGDNTLEVDMLTIRVNQARRMAAPTVPEFEALRKKISRSPRQRCSRGWHWCLRPAAAAIEQHADRAPAGRPGQGAGAGDRPGAAQAEGERGQAGHAGVRAGRAGGPGRRPGGQGAARAGGVGDGLVPLQLQGQPGLLEPAGPPVRKRRRAGAGAGLPRAAGPAQGDVPGRRHPPGPVAVAPAAARGRADPAGRPAAGRPATPT